MAVNHMLVGEVDVEVVEVEVLVLDSFRPEGIMCIVWSLDES